MDTFATPVLATFNILHINDKEQRFSIGPIYNFLKDYASIFDFLK
jgi:hypothetical protein